MNLENPGKCLAAGWAGSSCSKDVCQEPGVLPVRAGSSGWLSSGLASFSSPVGFILVGVTRSGTAPGLHLPGFALPAERAYLLPSSSCENLRESSYQDGLGHRHIIWSEAVRSDHRDGGGNVSQRESRGLLLEEGTDGNWVKTTDATS